MFNRKEYDRLRAKELYEDFKKRKLDILLLFNNKCGLCSKQAEKGFHLHHKLYTDKSNYPKHSNCMSVRWKRLKEAESNPEIFELLCPRCHILVEQLKTISPCVDRKKLIDLTCLL
jgi:hypothetical protein